MKRIVAVLMLAGLAWAAQENKNEPSKTLTVYTQKLFVLKYADPGQVASLLHALGGLNIDRDSQMRALAVTAEPRAMGVIEEAIKQLDTPAAAPKNVELTMYLVMGSDAEASANSAVPKELESVVAQLTSAFPFKSYRQMDLIEVRTRTGERVNVDSAGGLVVTNDNPVGKPVWTEIAIRAIGLAQDGSTVRLDEMRASIHWPDIPPPLSLNASVDVKEGQKVVVGRIGVKQGQALFLVLTAHLVP